MRFVYLFLWLYKFTILIFHSFELINTCLRNLSLQIEIGIDKFVL